MNTRSGISRRERWLLVALVAVALALIGALVARPPGEPEATPEAAPAQTGNPAPLGPLGDLAQRIPDDPMALGRVDAPVTIVMFNDYRCPFCAKFSRDTEPDLVARYVESGIVRLEWRDLAMFGPQSTTAAQAGRAAAAQGRFWEFNRAIYAVAPETGHADLTDERLVEFARQAGVPDLERFRADMRAPENVAAVQADGAMAATLGVPATPAFVINGTPMLGAHPLDTFVAAIERAAGGAS
ncbi:thioredoxin domain-containing protein [Pseudonocardia hispaniensis]|uniref:Thioredoxin domain-containing protein n=1 Tax=Pseudonocardia hispaniensis TaxID=904933 RepID=A0ABW1J7R8_9PSEU